MLKSIFITAVLATAAGVIYSTDAAVAVSAGGVIAAANFRLFFKQLHAAFNPDANTNAGKKSVIISAFLRYAMIGVVALIVIKAGIPPIFFLLGLSAVVAAIFFSYKSLKEAGEGEL